MLGVLGVVLYYAAVRPFVGRGGMAWVMSTIGFGIIIQNTALAIWGPSPLVMPSPLGNDVIRIGGAGVLPQEVLRSRQESENSDMPSQKMHHRIKSDSRQQLQLP